MLMLFVKSCNIIEFVKFLFLEKGKKSNLFLFPFDSVLSMDQNVREKKIEKSPIVIHRILRGIVCVSMMV